MSSRFLLQGVRMLRLLSACDRKSKEAKSLCIQDLVKLKTSVLRARHGFRHWMRSTCALNLGFLANSSGGEL